MEYEKFLESKALLDPATGIDVDESTLNFKSLPFQRAITRWALRRGRAAIWADCGLGKGLMALDWAN